MKNTLRTLQARRLQRSQADGFTLVELMIVVVIIGVLSAVAIPKFSTMKDRAKVGAANASAASLVTACELALTNDETALESNADITPLTTAYAKQLGTATVSGTTCSVSIPATLSQVKTAGSFVAFGDKTPAVAN